MNRSYHFSNHAQVRQRLYGLLFIPVLLLLFAYIIANPAAGASGNVSVWQLLAAVFFSFMRLVTAFILAVVVAIPLALLIHRSPFVERIAMPLLDTAYSVPVLAFFPVVILFFDQHRLPEGAAVFLIFITMVWALVIHSVNGLSAIPDDIDDTARIFGIKGLTKVRRVMLPAIVPALVGGTLLAWAAGWNMLLVAEVLHNYTPGRAAANDLFGIGSMIVNAAAAGQSGLFIGAVIIMLSAILLMNFFIWQRLQRFAQRYRFE